MGSGPAHINTGRIPAHRYDNYARESLFSQDKLIEIREFMQIVKKSPQYFGNNNNKKFL